MCFIEWNGEWIMNYTMQLYFADLSHTNNKFVCIGLLTHKRFLYKDTQNAIFITLLAVRDSA